MIVAKPIKPPVGPADKPPPWEAKNSREREWMERWVNARLNELDSEKLDRLEKRLNATNASAPEWSIIKAQMDEHVLKKALETAECGDMALLRNLYPRLARFINRPRLDKPGDHFLRDPEQLAPSLKWAIEDVDRIKTIWKQYYGKQNRRDGQLSALEIAANRHGVKLNDVERERNKLPKK